MAHSLASRMGRSVGFTATREKAAHKIAENISRILGTYIDPYSLCLWPATGYWAHDEQDVQRFTGMFPRPDMPNLQYDIGSWDMTISEIAKGCRFRVIDMRESLKYADADFEIDSDRKERKR